MPAPRYGTVQHLPQYPRATRIVAGAWPQVSGELVAEVHHPSA
jgi:hypothetical protein